jgi:peptide/nickel transport system permease protein
MARYLVRRLLMMVPVLVLVSIIAFSITLLLPGDPALAILGEQGAKNEQAYQSLRKELGLDQPLPIQYLQWARKTFSGDLGISIRNKQSVGEAIITRLAPTLQLATMAFLLGLLIAIPVGVISAVRPNSFFDIVGTVLALSGVAVPSFWLGIILVVIFSVWLKWLPPSGYVSLLANPVQSLKLMLLPSIVLATEVAAVLTRQVRSALLEVLRQDYMTTARAKGLREANVVRIHALKNAMLPVVTIMGLLVGRLAGGTVIVETIFSIPGVGRLAVDSIFFRDFPVVQGVVMVMAVAVLTANLAADFVYAAIDPRIRYR